MLKSTDEIMKMVYSLIQTDSDTEQDGCVIVIRQAIDELHAALVKAEQENNAECDRVFELEKKIKELETQCVNEGLAHARTLTALDAVSDKNKELEAEIAVRDTAIERSESLNTCDFCVFNDPDSHVNCYNNCLDGLIQFARNEKGKE